MFCRAGRRAEMFDKLIHDNGCCAADSSGSEAWQGGWQHPGGGATGRKP